MKKNKQTPWSYRKGYTPLHRLPGGFKLAFLLLLSLAAFIPGPELRSLLILAGIVLVLILFSFIARIGPAALLRGSGPLFIIILALFIFQGVQISPSEIKFGGLKFEEIKETIIFCVRMASAFSAGTLLFAVTTPGEIRKSLSAAESFFRVKRLKLSLSISLMLGFLPRFFEIWEDVNLAWESRGGQKNLSRLAILIPLAVERMMVKAAETALALEARALL